MRCSHLSKLGGTDMTRVWLCAALCMPLSAGCVVEDPFDSSYVVSLENTEIFGDWDATPLFEAPDVSGGILLNGADLLSTAEHQDTYQPYFAESVSTSFRDGDSLAVVLLDGDADGWETILRCEPLLVTDSILLDGTVRCASSEARVDVVFR